MEPSSHLKFLATFEGMKMLKTTGGWRIEFDVPDTEYPNIVALPALKSIVLRVSIEPETESLDPRGEPPDFLKPQNAVPELSDRQKLLRRFHALCRDNARILGCTTEEMKERLKEDYNVAHVSEADDITIQLMIDAMKV